MDGPHTSGLGFYEIPTDRYFVCLWLSSTNSAKCNFLHVPPFVHLPIRVSLEYVPKNKIVEYAMHNFNFLLQVALSQIVLWRDCIIILADTSCGMLYSSKLIPLLLKKDLFESFRFYGRHNIVYSFPKVSCFWETPIWNKQQPRGRGRTGYHAQ